MKAIILFCVIAMAFASEDEQTCLEEPDGGLCRGYFESYYYDYKSRSCKIFVYGGCGGNGNRYVTEEECMAKCGDVIVFDAESVCDLPAVTGMCFGYFPRFHFDKTTGTCKKFIYGGCGGNENNFRTEAECESRCLRA